MREFLNFNGAGTYLKVIRFPESTNPDGFVVLYLRPSRRFLWTGYWRGYERSEAVGVWERKSSQVRLNGMGRLATDSLPEPEGGRFERVFTLENVNETPILSASEELKGWSLLSWKGPYAYVGEDTIIDPDGRWLPGSLATVDERIERLAGA